MGIQTFDDGSNLIYKNVENDAKKLNLISEPLSNLTNMENIKSIIGNLNSRNILSLEDINKLALKMNVSSEYLKESSNLNVQNNVLNNSKEVKQQISFDISNYKEIY